MSEPILINLAYYSDTYPQIPNDEIRREVYLDSVKRYLENYDVVFLEGDTGVGKTTFLTQFVKVNSFNCISYFISSSFKFSFDPTSLKSSLFKQLNFYVNNKYEDEEEYNNIIDDNFLNVIYTPLLRKIKKSDLPLYFVFDGLDDISEQDLNVLKPILSQLPWTKAKFIFSGNSENLISILPPKIKYKTFGLSYFNFTETKEFLKEILASEEELKEIYSICKNGLPERLVQVKRLCQEMGGITKFLENEITEKTNLFEVEWLSFDMTPFRRSILSVIAFDETKVSTAKLAKLLKSEVREIEEEIKNLSFIKDDSISVVYTSESFKKFAQKKLSDLKDHVFELLINYYDSNPNDEDSLFNLPGLFQKAKRWKDILKFLSLNAFVHYIEKTQSLSSIKRQFDFGLEASKNFKSFTPEYLRFSLHKASIRDLEKHDIYESEIEARIALEDFSTAIKLANASLLKEDRLKLLSTIAKERKKRKLPDDSVLLDQIKDLYNQIDWNSFKEELYNIAALLLYSFPDLAIELIEKTSDIEKGENNLDIAFARLSFFVLHSNNLHKSEVVDSDLFSSKIKDDEIKHFATAIKFLTSDYDANKILEHVRPLKNNSKKLFLLRNWIRNNKKSDGVGIIMEFALNIILESADEDVPNATALADISTPLSYLKNIDETTNLIRLFDSQKKTITNPTKDFIRWQLSIVQALSNIDFELAKDRTFEVFLIIDEIDDLSTKTDCLCLLWKNLLLIDRNKEIEIAISSKATLEVQILENLSVLFQETAYHFKLIELVILTLVTRKPTFILNIISKVNIRERRDNAFHLSLKTYLSIPLDLLDFEVVNSFYSKIFNREVKEKALRDIIERLGKENEKALSFLPSLIKFNMLLFSLKSIALKSYCLTTVLKILHYDRENNKALIETMYKNLHSAWSSLDIVSHKIELGFIITKDLSEFDKGTASNYLNEVSVIKQQEGLTSISILTTYITSLYLCIEAFEGVIKVKDITQNDITEIEGLISHVTSNGDKLRLWNSLLLRLHSNQKHDAFVTSSKNYFLPILNPYSEVKDSHYFDTIALVAPSLYHFHALSFFERIDEFEHEKKDLALKNVADFIITKSVDGVPNEDLENGYKLTYEEHKDLCVIIEKITDDLLLYSYISEMCKSLKKHRLPNEQKNDIIGRLKVLTQKKLPNKEIGISHDGYLIVSKAHILATEAYSKSHWDSLITDAHNVPNKSDRAFVLTVIAEICNINNKKQRTEILDEAISYVKAIPYGFDKFRRFDFILKTAHDIGGKTLFDKIGKDTLTNILTDKDGRDDKIRSLIDTSQQYNSNLAEYLITLVDQDPHRKRLNVSFKDQIKENEEVKSARTDFTLLKRLPQEKVEEVFSKNLSDLESGRFTSKEIDDNILEILNNISASSLSVSYNAICFFIRNAVLKYRHNPKFYSLLYGIYNATYDNAKLIYLLSLDSIHKMENRFNNTSYAHLSMNPMIRIGEREKAILFLKEWLTNNLQNRITIIDSYFSEGDLELIQIIQQVNPKSHIIVLTSKESGLNCHENNELIYNEAWEKISCELPPDTLIQLVWDSKKKSPVHDRWIICEDTQSGLQIGTSFNSLGITKDAKIIIMASEDVMQIEQTVINDYIIRRVRNLQDSRLNYLSFQLLSD